MNGEESLWLVKASGRIIGPVTADRVGELLRSREISVMDEVSPPLKRWQTLQYHEQFKELVESVRRSQVSDRTEATWTPTGNTGVTQTVTDLADGELTDELTDELTGFTNTGKEIVIHDVKEDTQAALNKATGARFQSQSGQSTAVQRQVEKTTRGLWIVTILVLVGVAGFILQRRIKSGMFKPRPSHAQIEQDVIDKIRVGGYKAALKELKSYFTNPDDAGDLAIYYGSLLIQVEGQTVLGRRLMNSVISSGRPETKQAYTGLGLADLIDGQVDSAEQNFAQALRIDGAYVPALVDRATAELQKGDYVKARDLALASGHGGPIWGEALITAAESELYIYKAQQDARQLDRISRAIHDYLAHQWDYTSEIAFYGLYFDALRKDKMIQERLQSYLDLDPDLTTDHRHNLFVYSGRAQWKILGRFCEQLSEKLGDDAHSATLLASCYGHERRWDQAERYIGQAIRQAPKDPLVQSWYSYILRHSGDSDQASVVLGHANELNRRAQYVLPSLLQARFCQQLADWDCARDAWQKLYMRDLEYLPAVAGMAWIHAHQGEFTEASKLLSKGLSLSPDYIPLLNLQKTAEQAGWYERH